MPSWNQFHQHFLSRFFGTIVKRASFLFLSLGLFFMRRKEIGAKTANIMLVKLTIDRGQYQFFSYNSFMSSRCCLLTHLIVNTNVGVNFTNIFQSFFQAHTVWLKFRLPTFLLKSIVRSIDKLTSRLTTAPETTNLFLIGGRCSEVGLC